MNTLICSFDGLHDNRVLRYCADFEACLLYTSTAIDQIRMIINLFKIVDYDVMLIPNITHQFLDDVAVSYTHLVLPADFAPILTHPTSPFGIAPKQAVHIFPSHIPTHPATLSWQTLEDEECDCGCHHD